MRVRVKVGSVTVDVEGLELTRRDVNDLLRRATAAAEAVPEEDADEPEAKAPLGFTASMERAPEFVDPAATWYTDDEE